MPMARRTAARNAVRVVSRPRSWTAGKGRGMKLRDIEGWPPALTSSDTFRVVPSAVVSATLKRVGVYSIAGSPQPYLSIVVDYLERDWHAALQDLPEDLMRRIESTLRGQEGRRLSELGDLTIVEAA